MVLVYDSSYYCPFFGTWGQKKNPTSFNICLYIEPCRMICSPKSFLQVRWCRPEKKWLMCLYPAVLSRFLAFSSGCWMDCGLASGWLPQSLWSEFCCHIWSGHCSFVHSVSWPVNTCWMSVHSLLFHLSDIILMSQMLYAQEIMCYFLNLW